MNLVVVGSLDPVQLAELASLLTRCERADHHPALAEPQRVAASRPDLGGNGSQVVLAYEDSAGLVGCAFVTPALDGATALHVAVDPDYRTGDVQHELLKTALLQTTGTAGAPVRLWIMQATDGDDATAHDLGFVPERDLIQMRVPLPLPPQTVASARPTT